METLSLSSALIIHIHVTSPSKVTLKHTQFELRSLSFPASFHDADGSVNIHL